MITLNLGQIFYGVHVTEVPATAANEHSRFWHSRPGAIAHEAPVSSALRQVTPVTCHAPSTQVSSGDVPPTFLGTVSGPCVEPLSKQNTLGETGILHSPKVAKPA